MLFFKIIMFNVCDLLHYFLIYLPNEIIQPKTHTIRIIKKITSINNTIYPSNSLKRKVGSNVAIQICRLGTQN